VNFNPAEFNGFLNGIGQDVLWRRAFACPCVNPTSGQASAKCKHCKGQGRMWEEAKGARTGVAGGSVQKRWREFGMFDDSDIVLSVPSDSILYAIGPYDRVLFMNRSEPFSQNIIKGVNERINWFVLEVDRVFYENDAGELVNAPLPLVLPDGKLDWTGVEVPDGVTFSVTGRRRGEYFCVPALAFDRPHHAGATLPRRVVLRNFSMYQGQGQ